MNATRPTGQLLLFVLAAGIFGWAVAGSWSGTVAQGTPNAIARGDWPAYGLDAAETRFSPLTEITPTTIARLGLGWSTVIGEGDTPQEVTPLVVDGVRRPRCGHGQNSGDGIRVAFSEHAGRPVGLRRRSADGRRVLPSPARAGYAALSV